MGCISAIVLSKYQSPLLLSFQLISSFLLSIHNSTSLKYSTGNISPTAGNNTNKLFVAVCEVALGNMREFTQIEPTLSASTLPQGYDSAHGKKINKQTNIRSNGISIYLS